MPKSVQSKAKTMIREMWQAPSLEEAKGAYDQFCQAWATKYPKAVTCLRQNEQSLFSFYAFPAAHWVHLRTSNPIDGPSGARGLWVAHGDPDDGVEADLGGREDLAPADWLQIDTAGDGGARIRRRKADGGSGLGNGIRGCEALGFTDSHLVYDIRTQCRHCEGLWGGARPFDPSAAPILTVRWSDGGA